MKQSLCNLCVTILVLFVITPAQAQLSYTYNFDVSDTFWAKAITIDTVNYAHNQWQTGKPQKTTFDTALSLPNALITDTLYPYAPNDTSVFIVRIPGHILTSGTNYWPWSFAFNYKLDVDTTATYKIEFSSDTGNHWYDLADTVLEAHWAHDTLKPRTSWTSHQIQFPFWSPGFSDYLLRFTFISTNDTTGKDGWMIDNMRMYYGTEGVTDQANMSLSFAIYPNPATREFVILCKDYNDASVSIYDATGKLILKDLLTNTSTKISLPDLPPGLYLCCVNKTGEAGATQKLLIVK